MNILTDTMICGLILIIMFLSDYILKRKYQESKSKKIEIARVIVSITCLVAVVITVFVL